MAPQVGLEPTTLRLTVGRDPFLYTTVNYCRHLRISALAAFRAIRATSTFRQFLLSLPGISPGYGSSFGSCTAPGHVDQILHCSAQDQVLPNLHLRGRWSDFAGRSSLQSQRSPRSIERTSACPGVDRRGTLHSGCPGATGTTHRRTAADRAEDFRTRQQGLFSVPYATSPRTGPVAQNGTFELRH